MSRYYPHRGGNFERGKKSPLLWGRGNLGGILRDNLGEVNCESKIAAGQLGVNFCREASRCLAGPSGCRLEFIFFGAISSCRGATLSKWHANTPLSVNPLLSLPEIKSACNPTGPEGSHCASGYQQGREKCHESKSLT